MSGSNSSARGANEAAMPESAAGVSFTVHSQPVPVLPDDTRRTWRGRWKMLAVLAVCAAPVVASYIAYFVVRPAGGGTNYGELVTPRPVPKDLSLRTLDGTAVAPASLRGQWIMVVVGEAACDATCENQLYLQRQLRETLGRDAERVDKLWLVTDDAAPRPEVLAAIGGGDPATVLRVDPAELSRWIEPAAGHTLAQHLHIIDPMGNWMMREPARPDASKVKRDLQRLLRASASWDEPGRPATR